LVDSKNPPNESWRPAATPANLRLRARMLATTRTFFAARNVLEVDTPLAIDTTVSDPHTESVRIAIGNRSGWLRTSPEYHMKRMLAADSGDIFQLGKVFRGGESGARHHPEFTLLEWYRLGFTLEQMIDECCELIAALLSQAGVEPGPTQITSYRDAFLGVCGLDPLTAGLSELRDCAKRFAGSALDAGMQEALADNRSGWLDFLAGMVVFPALGDGALQVVADYPADQAMLARLNPDNTDTAERFEVFLNGIELANGYRELTSATEQAHRFETDNRHRLKLGKPMVAADEKLLAALSKGLPDCSGVAVGFDRVIMLAAGVDDIDATVSFVPLN
jgi:lysyl-tRNA synthetase class 2